jgi:hypothetical protein
VLEATPLVEPRLLLVHLEEKSSEAVNLRLSILLSAALEATPLAEPRLRLVHLEEKSNEAVKRLKLLLDLYLSP